MSSIEHMGGGVPEQPEEEIPVENAEGMEHPETSAEEAAAMTRQRRREYGLAEENDLTPEQVGDVDEAIEVLLDQLGEHDFDSESSEVQDEWYAVEMEAEAGKDRELARAVLEKFLRNRKLKGG